MPLMKRNASQDGAIIFNGCYTLPIFPLHSWA